MSEHLHLVTTQTDFDGLYQIAEGAFYKPRIDRDSLNRLLIDHSTLVAFCRKHGLKVVEPEDKGRRRVPLKR